MLWRDRDMVDRRNRRLCARWFRVGLVLGLLLPSARARADGDDDAGFDVMHLLSQHGLHDLDDEHWNAYGQITDIWSAKLGFSAKYTRTFPGGILYSLSPTPEFSFTETATVYLGLRLWP